MAQQTDGEKLMKTGAALSLAGCNIMIALPMLVIACMLIYCGLSIMFSGN